MISYKVAGTVGANGTTGLVAIHVIVEARRFGHGALAIERK